MKKVFIFLPFLFLLATIFLIKNIEDTRLISLVSPIPKSVKPLGLNLWQPGQVLGIQFNVPQITAKSAIFVDTTTGKALYGKNEHERLPIASLVKVMTVLIALEHKKMDDEYSISKKAADTEPDKMLLIQDERLTLKDLLYGIFLVSANDAAESLAEGTVGSREEFIKMMNSKALQLGMKDTYYVNPTGLDEDQGNSYSSAYDLSILTRYLIKTYPDVVDISSTYHIFIPKTDKHQDYEMYSGINLLTTYPGVLGFKTGFTPSAGLTLITLARKSGHEVIGVLLGSEYRRDEARELLDYSFEKVH